MLTIKEMKKAIQQNKYIEVSKIHPKTRIAYTPFISQDLDKILYDSLKILKKLNFKPPNPPKKPANFEKLKEFVNLKLIDMSDVTNIVHTYERQQQYYNECLDFIKHHKEVVAKNDPVLAYNFIFDNNNSNGYRHYTIYFDTQVIDRL